MTSNVEALEESIAARGLDADDIAGPWVELARDLARMIDAGNTSARTLRAYREVLEDLRGVELLSASLAALELPENVVSLDEFRHRKHGRTEN